jgi:hypothetical protein
MILLMVLAQCGAGTAVTPDKAEETLATKAEVVVEGVMTYHSVCPKCPPKAVCKPCDTPLVLVDPGKVKVRVPAHRNDLTDGDRVRARVHKQGKELVASCLEKLK